MAHKLVREKYLSTTILSTTSRVVMVNDGRHKDKKLKSKAPRKEKK